MLTNGANPNELAVTMPSHFHNTCMSSNQAHYTRDVERQIDQVLHITYIHLHIPETGFSVFFFRPLALPPGAGRLKLKDLGWPGTRDIEEEIWTWPFGPGPGLGWAHAFPYQYPVPSPPKSLNFQPPSPWRPRLRPTELQKGRKDA